MSECMISGQLDNNHSNYILKIMRGVKKNRKVEAAQSESKAKMETM